ncbi:Glutamate Receptor-Interacting Protein 2 [Manis pentadactyla]|nr:Glutamate Receptor-Interacting Protein 2 [Manis pentadactyla]
MSCSGTEWFQTVSPTLLVVASPLQLQPAHGFGLLWFQLTPLKPIPSHPCLSCPVAVGGMRPWDVAMCQSFTFLSCIFFAVLRDVISYTILSSPWTSHSSSKSCSSLSQKPRFL